MFPQNIWNQSDDAEEEEALLKQTFYCLNNSEDLRL